MKMTIRPQKILLAFTFLLVQLALVAGASAYPIEMKISQGVLQSFIDAAFPLTVKQEVNLLGTVKVPIEIHLHHPGPVRLMKSSGPTPSFLSLGMDYDITSDSGLIAPSKGKLGGDFTVVLSHDQEALILSFGEMSLQITPFLRISLASAIKPIRVPLFKGFPVRVQEKEVVGRFKEVSITVEGGDLLIKGDFFFEKNAGEKTEKTL